MVVLGGHVGFGMIIPLLPLISREFAGGPIWAGVLFSVYSACQLVASPVLGALSDRIGRRPVLVVSQLGSAAGYLLLGVALMTDWANPWVGYGVVLLSRVIDGATAGNVSAAQAYVNDVTGDDERGRSRALGLLGASFGLGFTLGPGLAALLAIFAVSAPAWAAAGFAAASAVMAQVLLGDTRRADVHGEEAEDANEPEADAAGGGAGPLPYAAPPPRHPLHPATLAAVLGEPRVGFLIAAWFLAMLAFVMVEPTMPLLLQDVFGFGQTGVGVFFFLIGLVIIVVQGGLIGRLTDWLGEWRLVLVGPTLIVAGMACYGLLPWVGLPAGDLAAHWSAGGAPGLVPWAGPLAVLALAGLLGATGRSIHTVASAGLIGRYAAGGKSGATYGVYNAAASLARIVGPLLATGLYALTPSATYATAAAITAAALAVLAWRRSAEGQEAAPIPPVAASA